MWEIKGDEFNFSETADINAPVSIVYETAAGVDKYDRFLTDVITAKMESEDICRMIVRAGPLRVDVATKVTYEKNSGIDFVMVDGPPLKRLAGTWIVAPNMDGSTNVTFKVNIKAGRAGKWLLKTASRYMERKGAALVEAFRQQILKESQT
jgi:ribosome-associated toxin RatA of RatAB toxin-antitoxin module